jgi:flavodoxin I
MKTLVVYDSGFGNTEKIANTIATALKADFLRIDDFGGEKLEGVDLLVVGSPTYGGRPTEKIVKRLGLIKREELKGVKVAVFDTRILAKEQGPFLKLLMKVIDYAAPKMARILEGSGGKLVALPEGFIVMGKEGPLMKGELERAKVWAGKLKV